MIAFLSYIFYFVAASVSPLQRRWLASHKNVDNEGQIHFAFQVTFITVILSLLLPFLQSLSWVVLIFVVGNLSLVSAITTFKVVVVFIAGAIFLKEREDLPIKIIGSVIALAGLLLMK